MNKSSKVILSALTCSAFFFSVSVSHAATFFLVPPSATVGVGDKITLSVKIDGEGVGFNGAQATIHYPKETLQVSSIDKSTSAFSFWLEDPNFSNNDGIISFIGGTPYGVSGSSVEVIKISFTTKGSGSAEISFGDAAITASDGSGTNILSKLSSSVLNVSPARTASQIQQITRIPVAAQGLPAKPNVQIPLYMDESLWYGIESPFNITWDLPADISGISTAVNKQPNSVPSEKSEGLFDNKPYEPLGDGIWHMHVRFRNNIGWGPTTHRKIAIDTMPPLGFDITSPDSESTDNPAPTIQFKTRDALSGLREYAIRIGDSDLIRIPADQITGDYQLPKLAPGNYRIIVKAIDRADNSVENSINFNILPIQSPSITFVTRSLFSDENGGVTVKGTALPNIDVLVSLVSSAGSVAGKGTARSNENGNWEFLFTDSLKNGTYKVKAISQDERGALSVEVESENISVTSKPIIQIGNLKLGKGGAMLVLLLVIVTGFVGGFLFYKKRQEKVNLRVLTAESDLDKLTKIVKDDFKKLEEAHATPATADDEFMLKKMEGNINKMETYLKKGIKKIKD